LKLLNALALLGVLAVAPACEARVVAPQAEGAAQTGLDILPLQIRTARGSHSFRAELARSEDQQMRGLMFRRQLGPDQGMLFPFPQPRPASFWMKNTLIPLDMLFIRADGSIATIVRNAVPLSLDPVGTSEPVIAVLELAGGRAAALGISEGDRVSWPGGPGR
jgi:uncharacterized membrane protein (UPF0127 family)